MRHGTCFQDILKFVQEDNIHKKAKDKIKSNRIAKQRIEIASDKGSGKKKAMTMS